MYNMLSMYKAEFQAGTTHFYVRSDRGTDWQRSVKSEDVCLARVFFVSSQTEPVIIQLEEAYSQTPQGRNVLANLAPEESQTIVKLPGSPEEVSCPFDLWLVNYLWNLTRRLSLQ